MPDPLPGLRDGAPDVAGARADAGREVKRLEPNSSTPRCCGVFMLWRERLREYVCLRCGNGSAGR